MARCRFMYNAYWVTGNKKGVFAHVKECHPNIYLSGSTLHLVHIAAKNAAANLPNVDDVLVDIYYYFNKSDKRKREFREAQDLYSKEQKMLKPLCTIWLSIRRHLLIFGSSINTNMLLSHCFYLTWAKLRVSYCDHPLSVIVCHQQLVC